jgi:YD repeat-containing protein
MDGINPTANVTFGYDAAENRTSMTDGLGTKSYSYNQLSQLMSETRTFTGVGAFTLSYDYNLAGELKKITDATNMTINYGYDSTGRVSSVTGADSLYAGVSNYASNLQYRAWGGLKAMTDGTNHVTSVAYNSKLQPSAFDISGNVTHQSYDYFDDGSLSFIHNTANARFDRSFTYDQAGRMLTAKSGGTARGDVTQTETPYNEIFGYDAFSNLNYRYTGAWYQFTANESSTYANNRHNDWSYDADGRNTNLDGRVYGYDAAGQSTSMSGNLFTSNGSLWATMESGYDGDGVKSKEVTSDTSTTTYYLRSSVLGGAVIEEMNSSGAKNVGYVYGVGQVLAQQSNNQVTWKNSSPSGMSQYNLQSGTDWYATELDPLGANVSAPVPPPPDNFGEGDFEQGHFGGIISTRFSQLTARRA